MLAIVGYNRLMSSIISSPDSVNYKAYLKALNISHNNGAYYYAREICDNIIPLVKTNRPWDTLGMRCCRSADRAIVFIHSNVDCAERYKWLDKYSDQILVCSSKPAYEWAKSRGKAIFLPLSIDTEYVAQFKTEKTKKACYAGNIWAFKKNDLKKYVPEGVDFPERDLDREALLRFIAPYKECYAIGRCALEAKVLGCRIKVCDSRYPNTRFWKVVDNKDAAKKLQKELDRIDRG